MEINLKQIIVLIVSIIVIGFVMVGHYLKLKLDSYNEWYKEHGKYE